MADELTPPGGDEYTADEPKKSRFGLPGRGRGKKEANAMAVAASPPAASKKPKKKAKKQEGSGGGLIGWLQDSYNGLFKIVIQPQLPTLRLTAFMLFALIFGILWAYLVVPVELYGANPNQLSQGQRDQYVLLVAGSYQAEMYEPQEVVTLLSRIEEPEATVRRLIQEEQGKNTVAPLQNILPLAQQANPGTAAPSQSSMVSDILSFVGAIVIFLVAINLFAIAWGLLIGGYVERAWERIKPKSEEERQRNAEAAAIKADIQRRKALQAEMEAETAQQAASDLGAPLTQRISTYTKGRQFDDSFAIEDENDMFLGECGATIAKTIGDSQELTAVEIWLFDKEDFVRTLTKVFVSPHAYNDPVIRAELEPKVDDPANDLVMIQPGAEIQLVSKMIVMKAKIADMTPGTVPTLPPNSHYEGLTIQVMAWEKKGSAVGAPAVAPAAAGLPSLDSYEIGTPPAMPSHMQTDQPPAPKPPAPAGLPSLDSYEIGPPPAMPSHMQTDQPPAAQPPVPKPPAPAGLPSLDSYEIGPPPAMPQSMSSQPTQPNPSFSAETEQTNLRPLSPPPMGTPGSQEPQFPRPAPGRFPSQLDDPDDEDDDDPFGGTGDFTPIGR